MSDVLYSKSLLLEVALTVLCGSSGAAELSLRLNELGPDEGFAEVHVHLSPGNREEIAGLQFDLHFDEALLTFESVKAGPAAESASKVVNYSLRRPGAVRVIIAGLNRNIIPSGGTAVFHFRVASPGVVANNSISIKRPILSDLYGSSVPVDVVPAPPLGGQFAGGGAENDGVPINAGSAFSAWTNRPQTVILLLALLIGGAVYLRFRFRRMRKNTL